MMVDTYLDKIIDLFVSEYTPEEICEEIRLCKPNVNSLISNTIYE